MPDLIQFKNGCQIKNTYSAGGQKLSSRYVTVAEGVYQPLNQGQVIENPDVNENDNVTVDGTDYLGNIEYQVYRYFDWDLTYEPVDQKTHLRVHNPEGYVGSITTNSLYGPVYYYYRKDHLGNNREVWKASYKWGSTTHAAATGQITQYYPSGLPWASNTGDNPGSQPYKYNGKEFVEMHGLDSYDYGARGMCPTIGRFTSVDPIAEDYYDVSPYAYVLNNPLNYTDPTGMSAKKENEDEPKDGGELTEIVVIAPKPEPKPSNFEIKTNVIVIPVPLAVSASLANLTRYVLPMFFLFNTIGSDTNRYYASNKNSPHANQKAKEAAKKEYEKTKEEYDKLYKKPNKTPNDKNNIEKLKRVLKHLKEKMNFKGETHSRNAKGN